MICIVQEGLCHCGCSNQHYSYTMVVNQQSNEEDDHGELVIQVGEKDEALGYTCTVAAVHNDGVYHKYSA